MSRHFPNGYTEFLHLPKIPLHATPAREGGPHAQTVNNQLGFLSPGAATHMLCRPPDTGNAHCSMGKASQTATGTEPKTRSKASPSSMCDKRSNDFQEWFPNLAMPINHLYSFAK